MGGWVGAEGREGAEHGAPLLWWSAPSRGSCNRLPCRCLACTSASTCGSASCSPRASTPPPSTWCTATAASRRAGIPPPALGTAQSSPRCRKVRAGAAAGRRCCRGGWGRAPPFLEDGLPARAASLQAGGDPTSCLTLPARLPPEYVANVSKTTSRDTEPLTRVQPGQVADTARVHPIDGFLACEPRACWARVARSRVAVRALPGGQPVRAKHRTLPHPLLASRPHGACLACRGGRRGRDVCHAPGHDRVVAHRALPP